MALFTDVLNRITDAGNATTGYGMHRFIGRDRQKKVTPYTSQDAGRVEKKVFRAGEMPTVTAFYVGSCGWRF
ncbi:hypothetical protein C7N43_36775 [Sphingobacteriales bacterium UPWRP_1]|nr:hypothetical protein B6N25_00565 [Sphingobacteriales bacterium TSM_CSS]PSJ71941.1 hypothetical protein C7N43_36775 [Sphingobacteriales bacterium UPWRP_1]